MPDDNKVPNTGDTPPASSPDANEATAKLPASPPDPGANGVQALPPFHEVIKHPEFQPFLDKQIEERVAGRTADTVAQVLKQIGIVKGGEGKEDNSEETKRLMANFDINEAQAKTLIEWRDTGVDKKTRGIEERFQVLDLTMRFGQVFQQNQDAKQYEGKMLEIFNGMNPFEKNFVMNSQDGAHYLYDIAKKRSGVLPPAARYAGTSTTSRSASASDKIGERDTQIGQALEAFNKGDRVGYERIMANVVRK